MKILSGAKILASQIYNAAVAAMAVRYDAGQSLTTAQQNQGRLNTASEHGLSTLVTLSSSRTITTSERGKWINLAGHNGTILLTGSDYENLRIGFFGPGQILTPDYTFIVLSGERYILQVVGGKWELASTAHVGGPEEDEPIEIQLAVSDETTALTEGDGKVCFRAPCNFRLTQVRASVTTAPTGAAISVQIRNAGNDVLSTPCTIDAAKKTSVTAATASVINATYQDFADDAEIHIDLDQVGSTIAGAGLKITILGTRL